MPVSPGAQIAVEVVYAETRRVIIRAYRLTSAASVGDALRLAASDSAFAGIDLRLPAVGVFGKLATLDQALVDGDRVEIYRPLAADPKSARRARAREAGRRA